MKFSLMFVAVFLCSTIFAGTYQETKNLSLPAENISHLKIDCGAGFLKVQGDPNLTEIQVTAEIELRNVDRDKAPKILDKYLDLSLKKHGSRAILISDFDHSGSFFSALFGDHPQITIDLTVKVPQKLGINIDDGSGFIEVSQTNGDLEIDDGSGDLTIRNAVGDIEIDDGSGGILIKDITGKVEIDDGSGEINISGIKGDVRVDDGSGSIIIDDVDGNVIIEDDGSGGVHIANVTGKVIRRDQ
ncbi:MAG: hypothetical protein P8Y60_05370 [Calditrichota bacterium]|jgi:DUF4097 and DUF4098 domain-containing protein YvlB